MGKDSQELGLPVFATTVGRDLIGGSGMMENEAINAVRDWSEQVRKFGEKGLRECVMKIMNLNFIN